MSELNQSIVPVSKIRVKFGNIEIDFEGTEKYIRDDLPSLLELIFTCSVASENNLETDIDVGEAEELPASPDPAQQRIQMTTNTIAAKLNVKTGADLAVAACAHLCLVKGVEMFERKNILAEMQTASNYYQQSYSKNLSRILSRLVKDNKLIERSKDKYALTANTKKDMEALLA
jgi:hypothetical protein